MYLAKCFGVAGFERLVALKRILPTIAEDDEFIAMFIDEAKIAGQLNHANVAQIFDLGKINQSYFIAMEYISGRDMSRIIPKGEKKEIPFPMIYALKIASNCLEGLYYAHTKTDAYGNPLNIVHRDITPENVLVGFNGTVRIVDFGIAKASTQLEQTRAGEIKGKLSYMSPEQAMGQQLDARSDIFALGAVLYEWITGYKLFTGENEMAILKSIIDGKIYPPSYFKEDVPEAVEKILMKALAKDREDRYQSAWEMQFDVDTFVAASQFTPSNIHLANFLKQIFEDEMHREAELLKKSADLEVDDEVSPGRVDDEILELEDIGGRALSGAGGQTSVGRKGSALDRQLTFKLSERELSGLRSLADRKQCEIEDVIRELVRDQLKWLS